MHTSTALDAVYMLVLGLGIGGVMQVLVIIVQNGVPHSELGVATSGATFFRSIGGSFGTAIGAIVAVPIAALAFLATWLIPQVELKQWPEANADATPPDASIAVPGAMVPAEVLDQRGTIPAPARNTPPDHDEGLDALARVAASSRLAMDTGAEEDG